VSNKPENCPKCNSSWIGEPIPQEYLENYSGTHWKREIGIDGGYMGIYDGLVALLCPDCGEYSPVSDHRIHLEMFNKFMNYNKANEVKNEEN
jgi:hypothetical protein